MANIRFRYSQNTQPLKKDPPDHLSSGSRSATELPPIGTQRTPSQVSTCAEYAITFHVGSGTTIRPAYE
jgi:hypothetical protein